LLLISLVRRLVRGDLHYTRIVIASVLVPPVCICGMVKSTAASSASSSSKGSLALVKDACGLCKAKRGSDNPIKKGRGAESAARQFVSGRALCYPCRNFTGHVNMPTGRRHTVVKAVEGSQVHTDYTSQLHSYVEAVNSSDNGYLKKHAEFNMSTTVAKETSELLASTFLGIWWPESTFRSIKKKNIPAGKTYMHEGKAGIIMDETDGRPIGTVRLEKTKGFSAEISTPLAGGDDFGTDAARTHYTALQDALTIGVATKGDEDADDGYTVKVPKARPLLKRSSDSSSEVDWLSGRGSGGATFGSGLLAPGVGNKKLRTEAAPSDSGGAASSSNARNKRAADAVTTPKDKKASRKYSQLLKEVFISSVHFVSSERPHVSMLVVLHYFKLYFWRFWW
jgi:hypothetical protein